MRTWPRLKDLPPIEADELAVWLSMTGSTKNWPTKTRIVGVIGSRVGGDWWTAEMVAKHVGLSVPYTGSMLRKLAADRVLWRDGGGGKRDTLFWVEVNPKVEQWLNVEWVLSPFERTLRIGQWAASKNSTATGRFVARPCYARRAGPVARFMVARVGSKGGGESRAPGPRDDGSGPFDESRDPRTARLDATVVNLLEHRGFGGAPQEVLSTGDGASESSSSEPADAGGADPFVVDLVAALVQQRAKRRADGARFVRGAPLATLAQLVKRYGEAVTVAAIDRVPDEGQMVPHFIDDLAKVLALGGLAERPTTRDVDAERSRLLEKRERRVQLLATYEELGDDERAAICRAELDACDTELAAIDALQEEAL